MQVKEKGDIWDDSCDSPSTVVGMLVTLTDGEDWVLHYLVYILFWNLSDMCSHHKSCLAIPLIHLSSLRILAVVSQILSCKIFNIQLKDVYCWSRVPEYPAALSKKGKKKTCKEFLFGKDRTPKTDNLDFWNLTLYCSCIIYSLISLLHMLQHVRIWSFSNSPMHLPTSVFCTSLTRMDFPSVCDQILFIIQGPKQILIFLSISPFLYKWRSLLFSYDP